MRTKGVKRLNWDHRNFVVEIIVECVPDDSLQYSISLNQGFGKCVPQSSIHFKEISQEQTQDRSQPQRLLLSVFYSRLPNFHLMEMKMFRHYCHIKNNKVIDMKWETYSYIGDSSFIVMPFVEKKNTVPRIMKFFKTTWCLVVQVWVALKILQK